MQVESAASGGKNFSGLADCARHVYAEGGIRSVYKGTILTLARDIPGSIAWFGTYEIMKRELAKWQGVEDPSKLSPVSIMVAGGFAGMACWYVKQVSTSWIRYRIIMRTNVYSNLSPNFDISKKGCVYPAGRFEIKIPDITRWQI